jgi:tetratricopeptide (TPR) repeat protein
LRETSSPETGAWIFILLSMIDERDLESTGVSQSMDLYNESLPFYDKVIARNQSNFMAWHYKGTTLSKMGRYDEAMVCFDRALEIKPDYKAADDARKEGLMEKKRTA